MSVMIPALIIYVNDLPPSNVMVGEYVSFLQKMNSDIMSKHALLLNII